MSDVKKTRWKMRPIGLSVTGFFILLGLLGMTLLIGYVSFSRIYVMHLLSKEATRANHVLSHAHFAAVNSSLYGEETAYGVHLSSSSLIFFQGDEYSPEDPNNVLYALDDHFRIGDVFLRLGTNNIVYAPESGETQAYGRFSIMSRDNKSIKALVRVEGDGEVVTKL